MRSIETALKALEKRARKCKDIAPGDYCRKHLPPPVLLFEKDGEQTQQKQTPEPPTVCHICGKPYPPDAPRIVIAFEDTPNPEPPRR